ncbi:hypothetical protein GCM10008018_16740 [Paenibacillus marchantiophytorum]|uniref:Response regulator n=1 Tax=Paenibacillus marchantiophytorum TaxID=1619310 RepID=A0ABQ2BS76_9BACL|nr:response regulator [Paenibacillus marchantiophytorum]GGI46367.1 hypothetical protein GCM10008018_16740 [Paenibacillus marchantiophytorum]
MLKVLIIDDEEPSRDALKILGDWDRLGVQQILEANGGLPGIELINEHRPDIVLLDMKMPEVNGPEVLSMICQDHPHIATIVISGYGDFQYTKQAIQSHVVDYILKPLARHDLNRALDKAVAILETRKKVKNEFLEKNIVVNISLPKLKSDIYMSIIEGKFHKQNQVEHLKTVYDEGYPYYQAFTLSFLNLEHIQKIRFHNDLTLLYFAVSNVINEFGSQYLNCFSFQNPRQDREFIIVICGQRVADMNSLSRASVNKAMIKLKELFGLLVVGAAGTVGFGLDSLSASYHDAKDFLLSINLLSLKDFILTDSNYCNSKRKHSINSRIPLFRNAFRDSDSKYAKGILDEFIGQIKKSNYFSLGDAQRSLEEFQFILHDLVLELCIHNENSEQATEDSLKPKGFILDYVSFEQYCNLLYQILHSYFAKIGQGHNRKGKFHISLVKEYIEQCYFEEISIAIFTERYFLSRQYLMKLFKQEYRCGIYEYLQIFRMNKAKELLDDPKLKIQQIAEMLGYKDTNYFSKAFKNYFGHSPSDNRGVEENNP